MEFKVGDTVLVNHLNELKLVDVLGIEDGRVKVYFNNNWHTPADDKVTLVPGDTLSIEGEYETLWAENALLKHLDCSKATFTSSFFVDGNLLTSLEGSPEFVGEDFDCSDNPLTSLKGCPDYIESDMIVPGSITDWRYLPKHLTKLVIRFAGSKYSSVPILRLRYYSEVEIRSNVAPIFFARTKNGIFRTKLEMIEQGYKMFSGIGVSNVQD